MQLQAKKRPTKGMAAKGHPKKGGRQKGTPNGLGRQAQEMIIKAMMLCGEDGNGKGKAIGFLKQQCIDHPKAYLALFAKILPYQVQGPEGGPVKVAMTSRTDVVHHLAERGVPAPPSLMERIVPLLGFAEEAEGEVIDVTPETEEQGDDSSEEA
jgi:hypothetical protein